MDRKDVKLYVDDRVSDGIFRVHKEAFTDPVLFDLEMRYVFERVWNFLGLESQIPKPHDFFTTHIGRTPVIVTRGAGGELVGLVNACRHKGAMVCRAEQGRAKYHVCPYHGWAYDSSGKNVDVKDRPSGGYSAAFEADNHDLARIAKIASYRGFVFGSLSPDVPPLPQWLGDMAKVLDLTIDQGPKGVEFIPGRSIYTFKANWKLQLDNALDGYHLTSTHVSFMDLQARRRKGEGHLDANQYDWATRAKAQGGMFSFVNGHSCTWVEGSEPEKRPIWPSIEEIRARVGETRTSWMLNLRQLDVFPNMQINDAQGVILRIMRPLAPDLTEMRTYCLAPIGERPEVRAQRLRQYEDFFNPGGMATPDDTVTYAECQRGFPARGFEWVEGYARGMTVMQRGGNELSRELGIDPSASVAGPWNVFNEVALHAPYREWARLLAAGMAGEKAFAV